MARRNRLVRLAKALIPMAAVSVLTPVSAMATYLWKYRPVIVLVGPGGDTSFAEQQRIFASNRTGLSERDIVVVWVSGDNVRSELGPGPGLSASQLRARYGAPAAGFKVVLVGKDGGTKLSQSTPLTLDRLFGTIDAMPMRREEMRKNDR